MCVWSRPANMQSETNPRARASQTRKALSNAQRNVPKILELMLRARSLARTEHNSRQHKWCSCSCFYSPQIHRVLNVLEISLLKLCTAYGVVHVTCVPTHANSRLLLFFFCESRVEKYHPPPCQRGTRLWRQPDYDAVFVYSITFKCVAPPTMYISL